MNKPELCPFCQGDGCIDDEYGEWTLKAVKITPLPPIVLSGSRDIIPHEAEKPYWALFAYNDYDDATGERASYPIKFCPECGRRLDSNAR